MHDVNWVDKTFEFGLSLEELSPLLERLRAVPSVIERLVAGAPAEHLAQRVDGAWSIQEHVGHLTDLEELHEGRLVDFEGGLEVLRAADMTNRKTEEAHHNDANLDDLLASFRAVRTQFLSHLESMGEAAMTRSALHPRLQKQMRPVDLAYFVAEHDDHHVAAIARLCSSATS
ncbi:MAG TPA: DinB family protein [Chloroflexia bacterium]|nr:DinB family protein [Chloroflexia bacterium]